MVKEYGYEYNAVVNEELIAKTKWNGTNEKLWGAYCLRSGRDALKIIAREYPNSTVYLPSLCCDSMVTPFELYNCKIVYYPLESNMKACVSVLLNLLKKSYKPSILLFYDYFGISMFDKNELVEIKEKHNDLILVKDITHTLLDCDKIDTYVDYTIASLRKWLNIPDGGLLWTNSELHHTFIGEDSLFAEQRLTAQCLRTDFFEIGDESIKETYRKLFSNVSLLLDKDDKPIKMTEYSFELSLNADWEKIKKTRRENAKILIDIFSNSKNITILNDNDKYSPIYLSVIVKNRDIVQSKLSRMGIFNTIIWPLRKEQKNICNTAKYIEENMLAVPCDQRYTKEDMLYIGEEIMRCIDE